ncbi:tRNA nucleotidyltransferase (CCA-adding enzyme) [Desulfacinum hydrothermale DSM 13146]|uniref:tRNA nucleotidyltransferase (CCA-adding enzyme) n=1 Tax=Desulfacinum hydrothermale DSM 13146 TaxID=1121390 RepID=A0A1W1XHA3_9BACT|nr:CBS domain-containing protein [Desulfacinum hydrothermale]SMC23154.1 tRNA nucleotidyltransferase (CCA-adding enzyme) [Desulfacinum hydrothermale DSM 13146]
MDVITTHLNADFDAMASMVAAKKLYPEALLVFPGSQEKNLREFFVSTAGYLFDFTKLKGLDLEQVTRLVLVDTRQASRIGKFRELIEAGRVEVHIYDHHPDAEDDVHGSVEVVKPVGATVTLLTELIRQRGIPLSSEEATMLILGIFEDTGSFTFSSTTPEDFRAAAYLVEQGADLNMVSDLVTRELTAEQVALLNELLQSARTYNINGVDVCVATVSVDKYVGDFAVLVHKLKDMENLDVIFALARMEDRIYLVARSRIPEVNVGEIAAHFGGGGHATAASATIRDLTLIQAEDRLFELLQSTIKPSVTARTLMSSPVLTADAESSLGQVEEIMLRYNINAMPVLEKGRLAGLINRQVVEKAIYHGLRDQKVSDYMNRDFSTVQASATLMEIQKHLVEHQQRILPVMDGDRLVGVVTRRDLLNHLITDRSREPMALKEEMASGPWGRRKNVTSVLAEQLPREIIGLLRRFGELGQELHYKVYAVGGFVRDLLLRRPNLDIDIVVEGDGIRFAKAFAEREGIRARCHKKFNTAVLIFDERLKVDVATARLEYYQYPAALPVVQFGSLKMDLYRRDFTINTLALALNPDEFGQLIDFFGGQRDIKDKAIRVLHNLSFVEDPTRILRAIRFEQRFGFRVGKQTASLMRHAVKIGLIDRLGGQRLFHEIQHILMEEDPVPAVRRMAEFGVLEVICPNVCFDAKAVETLLQIKEVLSWYELSFLEEPLEGWRVYLLGLLSRLHYRDLGKVLERLDLPKNMRERIAWTFQRVNEVLGDFLRLPPPRPSAIYRALQPFRPEEILFMMATTQREEVRRAISHYFHRYRHVQPEIRGRDLQEMGIPPGPIYAKILDRVLDARLNGELRSRQEELALARAMAWRELGAGEGKQ